MNAEIGTKTRRHSGHGLAFLSAPDQTRDAEALLDPPARAPQVGQVTFAAWLASLRGPNVSCISFSRFSGQT
jgi:hypothetical protein